MTMITGVVEAVATKEVTTKFGVKPTYSIKVNGNWIKCGFKNPGADVGFTIDCDAVSGTYGIETKAINILSRTPAVLTAAPSGLPAAPSAAPSNKGSYTYKEKVFPIPALHGDRAIVRQNALARATDLYIAARGGKAFELEVGTLDLVITFARKFEAYTAGDLDLEEATKEVANEAQPQEE